MNFQRKTGLRIAFQLLGIALFVVILSRIEIGKVLDAYRNFDVSYVIYSLLIMFLFITSKSLRWKLIVAVQGIGISPRRAFTVYASALYLGIITPGRIGDFAKSLYLMRTGQEPGRAIFSTALDRLFDIVFLVVIGYISLLFFPGIFGNQLLLSSLVVGIVLLVVLVLLRRRDLLAKFTERFIRIAVPPRFRESLSMVVSDVLNEFGLLHRRDVLQIVLYSIGAWLMHYLFFILAARALNLDISIPVLVTCISAAIFTSLLPISLLGLGTRDAVLILIFGRVGLSREAAVSFSFTFMFVYLIIGLIGLACWLTAPFHRELAGSVEQFRGEDR